MRAGGIEPLGNQPVSIAERFFAGGRTTHRAYGRDELGIPGETLLAGKPIGGKGLFLFNVDYRFPLVGGARRHRLRRRRQRLGRLARPAVPARSSPAPASACAT